MHRELIPKSGKYYDATNEFLISKQLKAELKEINECQVNGRERFKVYTLLHCGIF